MFCISRIKLWTSILQNSLIMQVNERHLELFKLCTLKTKRLLFIFVLLRPLGIACHVD